MREWILPCLSTGCMMSGASAARGGSGSAASTAFKRRCLSSPSAAMTWRWRRILLQYVGGGGKCHDGIKHNGIYFKLLDVVNSSIFPSLFLISLLESSAGKSRSFQIHLHQRGLQEHLAGEILDTWLDYECAENTTEISLCSFMASSFCVMRRVSAVSHLNVWRWLKRWVAF